MSAFQPPAPVSLHPALSASISAATGMTLAAAMATPWTKEHNNRPIADLLAARLITSRDLAWAAENAYNKSLRAAAKTILIHRLLGEAQPPQSRLLRVVQGSHYGETQERRSLVAAAVLFGAALTILSGMFLWCIGGILHFWISRVWAFLVVLVFGGICWAMSNAFDRSLTDWENYRTGRLGEESAVEELRGRLDGSWTLYRNLVHPQHPSGDIDLLLVGPQGIWDIEVKAYHQTVRNRADRWEYKGKRRWRGLSKNPGHQARKDAESVHWYLGNHGVTVRWVEAAVLWAGDPALLEVKDPRTAVWTLPDLQEKLDKLLVSQNPLSPEQVHQVTAVLDKLVEEIKGEQVKGKQRRRLRWS